MNLDVILVRCLKELTLFLVIVLVGLSFAQASIRTLGMGPVTSIAFSPDGKYMAAGSIAVHLIDTNTWQVIRIFEGRKRPVFSLSFSPDGKLLASASIDGTVRLWDVAAAREVQMFTGHADAVGSVCFSPDGKLLFFGSDGRTIKIWSVK